MPNSLDFTSKLKVNYLKARQIIEPEWINLFFIPVPFILHFLSEQFYKNTRFIFAQNLITN